jgi:hypothetical protein
VRIFAHWAIVYFWQLLIITKEACGFGHFFPREKLLCISLHKKWVGLHFGRVFSQTHLGPIFRTFFPGKIPRKISRKIFTPKCWERIEFSAEKVLKNRFSKKFRGKKCTKNRPLVTLSVSGNEKEN